MDIRPLRSAFALIDLGSIAGNPTAPHKAGNDRRNGTESDALKEARPRLSLGAYRLVAVTSRRALQLREQV